MQLVFAGTGLFCFLEGSLIINSGEILNCLRFAWPVGTRLVSPLPKFMAAFAQIMPVINGKATAKPWDDVEIPVSGWSASKPYTQTVTVNGMLATYTPVADIIFADNADDTTIEAEESYYNCVKRIIAGDNSITLVCTSEKPAGTFHIHLKEVS